MNRFHAFTRRGRGTTASNLVFKVVVIFVSSIVAALLATSVASTGDHLARLPVSPAYARDPDLPQKASSSAKQDKSWDPAEYAPALETLNF
jgi:hypothetical protein